MRVTGSECRGMTENACNWRRGRRGGRGEGGGHDRWKI